VSVNDVGGRGNPGPLVSPGRKNGDASILLVYLELKEALTQPGCPLCQLAVHTERRYLSAFLYENVLDVGVREALHSAWGFCPRHTWMVYEIEEEEYHDGMGTAIVQEDLLGRVAEVLERYRGGGETAAGRAARSGQQHGRSGRWWLPFRRPVAHRGGELVAAFRPAGKCPACRHVASMEDIYIHEVLAHLEDDDFLALLRGSEGLCLPHFVRVVQAYDATGRTGPPDAGGLGKLVEMQLHKVRELRGELGEYLRKHSYEHAHEPKGSEQSSPRRAVEKMVGKLSIHTEVGGDANEAQRRI